MKIAFYKMVNLLRKHVKKKRQIYTNYFLIIMIIFFIFVLILHLLFVFIYFVIHFFI